MIQTNGNNENVRPFALSSCRTSSISCGLACNKLVLVLGSKLALVVHNKLEQALALDSKLEQALVLGSKLVPVLALGSKLEQVLVLGSKLEQVLALGSKLVLVLDNKLVLVRSKLSYFAYSTYRTIRLRQCLKRLEH